MAIKKKSGIHSPISLAAIDLIATRCGNAPRLLIAYLVLARFTHKDPVGTHGPNMVTGASATAVAEAMEMRWSRAKELIKKLLELGVIRKAEKGLVAGKSAARYVMQFKGDVAFPHALIDGLNEVAGIARLLEAAEDQSLQTITAAVVALVHCYRLHDMNKWGGVCPQAVHAEWVIRSVTPEGRGFKVNARRATTSLPKLEQSFCEAILNSLGIQAQDFSKAAPTLAAAFRLLSTSGLIYEAVSLFDDQQQPIFPVRLNDVHAALSQSEASYIETIPGPGFYTQPENAERKPEGMHFLLPFDPTKSGCSLMGVTRLRFRCCDEATAKGLERDAVTLSTVKNRLVELDLMDDFEMAA